MTAERAFRILWGPTLENTLDFAWPVVGSMPLHWRAPRPESQIVTNGTSSVAWITGRYYRLKVTAQYFGGQQNFGATGLQAFIDWAADSNAFTLVPNILVPALTVTGCYLEGPFDALSPSLEADSTQTLDLTILHPTQDLGLAWRGVYFEYDAGGSLTDPLAYTFTRANIGYEIGPDGYLHVPASGVACDGHYPNALTDGVQTTLFAPAVTNDIPNPEDLTNATWTKSGDVTIAANKATAPDLAITADQLVEGVGVTQFHAVIAPSVTIAAGDIITAIGFVRSSGRYRGLFRATNAGNTDGCGVNYDLSAGTLTSAALGTGTLIASKITPLAGGWFMIWWRGTIDPATSTSYLLKLFTQDASGSNSYTGDGASGVYFWGATAVHGAANTVARYTPTTSAKDALFAVGALANFPPQASWFYVKLVEAGARYAPAANFPSPLNLGSFAAPNWRTIFYFNGTGHYSFANGNNVAQVIATTGGGDPAVGQVYELLGLIFADGSVKVISAIAGGVETSSSQTAAPATAIPTSYGANDIGIGGNGAYGTDVHQIATIKFGPNAASGPSAVLSIAAARVQ